MQENANGPSTRALTASVLLVLACRIPTVAAQGAAASDYAASRGESLEAQLEQRLRERVRTIPGTDTRYLVGGYVQLDAMATRSRQDGDEQDTFFTSATPFGPADPSYRLSIRQSQINWVSRTPTGAGPVWTRVQANLFPLDGSTGLELNQLFVRVDDWLVVGKTYSTFMDDGALPTTLDYNGPGGVTFVRQWLARGSVKLGSGWAIEGSIEPQVDRGSDTRGRSLYADASRPDLAARVRYEGERGHLQLAGLSSRADITATTPLGSVTREMDGNGVSLSGSLAVLQDDRLLFQAVSGKGVGRYFNDPLSTTGVALTTGSGFDLVRSSGATLYYQHKWAPDWMTVAGASTLWVDAGGLRPAEALRRSLYGSVNLIHRLTPQLIVGAEALLGKVERVDGNQASNVRLQFSVRYLVF